MSDFKTSKRELIKHLQSKVDARIDHLYTVLNAFGYTDAESEAIRESMLAKIAKHPEFGNVRVNIYFNRGLRVSHHAFTPELITESLKGIPKKNRTAYMGTVQQIQTLRDQMVKIEDQIVLYGLSPEVSKMVEGFLKALTAI